MNQPLPNVRVHTDVQVARVDHAAALAFFLQDNAGSIFGEWRGRMKAAQQRALFGRFLGKGTLTINGERETLTHTVKVCFGLDAEDTASLRWAQL
jgi:hypothetical protein